MDINQLLVHAQRSFLQKDFQESIDAFTKVIETGEAQEVAYLSRGVARFQLKEHDKAIEDFSRVLKLNDKNSRAYYYRGMSFLMKEEFENAVADLDRSIGLNPDNKTPFFARGIAYAELGNEDEAAKNIKTALMSSEANIQGFADSYGMFRTQFEKAFSIMTGKTEPPTVALSEEEKQKLMKWLEETEQK